MFNLNRAFNLVILFLVVGLMLSIVNPVMGQETSTAYVSFYPLYDAATKIGGNQIDIKLVIPNGAEVHSYKPSPQKIAQLETADIFFYNGVGLESWADKAVQNLKGSKVKTVNLSKSVDLLPLADHHNKHHNDPHIWLDPLNMKMIGEVITEEFCRLDPEHKEIYQQNFDQFAQQIDQLHKEYKTVLADKQQKYILVSHSAFGYLTNRYGLEQISVTGIAPHEEPSPNTLARLTQKANQYNLNYIFRETLSSPKTVNALAQEADLEILPLNPIAGLTETEQQNNEDYFSLMRQNLDNLKKAVKK
ncbi:metal ABC transporter substrate-binding protein [Acetohalobium arabaticum]|uniref:Periplasmic solute binding protein n=1 Tax=Acetohalobium arabaticum (strain ATCC 49924 / DSM 5501 / Z-7288) TaxID=574087 RepID=D9QRA5_ACEAZ|nr:zinc ABC transporter substrate-binding protein [Acetohalobium arabaticum]ADL13046.1 periplasmic solute binding protein [Acetohalobium arabaticum DSM 5501]